MIKEDFVSYDIALLLKEKGFREKCIATYNLQTLEFNVEEVYQDWTSKWQGYYVSVPTLQMALKWLRDVHHLYIAVGIGCDVDNPKLQFYTPYITQFGETYTDYLGDFDEAEYETSEEAASDALKYALENLVGK